MRRKFPRIRRARRVSLKPGDAVVLEADERLHAAHIEALRVDLARRFPGVTTIVLDGGVRLAAILDQPPAALVDALERKP